MPKHVLYTGKKRKKNKFNRLQIEVFPLPNINPTTVPPCIQAPLAPNKDPLLSTFSFVCLYAQGVLMGFYGINNNHVTITILRHIENLGIVRTAYSVIFRYIQRHSAIFSYVQVYSGT